MKAGSIFGSKMVWQRAGVYLRNHDIPTREGEFSMTTVLASAYLLYI